MIKVSRYSDIIGSDKYHGFLMQDFKIDMLYPINKDNSNLRLFYGWKGKDMVNWYKFTDIKNNLLEFYSGSDKMNMNNNFTVPKPIKLFDFIEICLLLGIQLYWIEEIDEMFRPEEYINRNEIKDYYVNLLKKMDKSFELL
jgi:hypothetical protein